MSDWPSAESILDRNTVRIHRRDHLLWGAADLATHAARLLSVKSIVNPGEICLSANKVDGKGGPAWRSRPALPPRKSKDPRNSETLRIARL